MAGNRTLAIIKPDAFEAGKTGRIIAHLEANGFEIVAARVMRLSKTQAERFYAVHRERPFYRPLVEFMTSGPCMPLVIQRADAVTAYRKVIGATDPAQAEDGTVRRLYAESKERNAVHGSDSDENAAVEIGFFFSGVEVLDAR